MDHFPKEPQKKKPRGTRAGEVLENRHYMERRHYEGRMRVEDQARAAAANRWSRTISHDERIAWRRCGMVFVDFNMELHAAPIAKLGARKMESYRLPFCAVIALWLLTVQVIGAERPVLGQGMISCSLWLEGRQTDSPSAASRTAWALGFMSAFNQYGLTSERADVSEGKSSEELMAWIDNYCRQHQGDHLHMALQAFIDDFRQRIQRLDKWIY
jgi:hypothetical protein